MFKKLIILSIIVWYVIMSIHNCLCIWYHRIMYAAMPMPPVYRNGMETKMGKNGTLSFARRAAELTVGGVYLCVLYTICALPPLTCIAQRQHYNLKFMKMHNARNNRRKIRYMQKMKLYPTQKN